MKKVLPLFVFAFLLPMLISCSQGGAAIAPLVKENTIAVVHVDFTKLDFDGMFTKVNTIAMSIVDEAALTLGGGDAVTAIKEGVKSQIELGQIDTTAALKELSRSGVQEAYFLALEGPEDEVKEFAGFWAVPGSATLTDKIKEFSKGNIVLSAGEISGFSIFPVYRSGVPSNFDEAKAKQEFLDMFNKLAAGSMGDFSEALKQQAGAPIRMAVALSQKAKDEMLANIPQEVASAPGVDEAFVRSLVTDTKFIAVGVTPNKLKIQVVTQLGSFDQATKAETVLKDGLAKSAQGNPQAAMAIGMFKPMIDDLMPKANGSQLVFNLDESFFEKHKSAFVGMVPMLSMLGSLSN